MKILLCTNAFETVSNGPAKFAHLVLEMERYFPDCEVRVLTEDCTTSVKNKIYKQQLNIPRILKPLGMFLRMFQYHKQAMSIKHTDFNFDYLVYNNAIVGIWSGLRFKNTIGFINDDTYATTNWKSFWGLNWTKGRIFFITEKIACKCLQLIIVNSNYLGALIQKKYNAPAHKVKRLYKAKEIDNELHTKSNPIPTILFVKNDYLRGGLFNLVDALKQLSQPFKLIIAGPHAASKQSILAYIGQQHQLEVAFKGIITPAEVYDNMRKADIFCVPSTKEALGVANIEALALGCTVISTQVGGIPEVLDNGNNGWLVPPNNPHALANAIQTAISNPDLCAEKTKNGHIFVEQFNLGNMLSNFKQLITNLG